MRLFLLFTLISLTSFGQVRDTTLTGIQLSDRELFQEVLLEFKHESRKEGVFIDHFISQDLGGITFLTEEEIKLIDQRKDANSPAGITYLVINYDALGYWHRSPMIGIHEDMKRYGYRLIKMIIYHELGHFFGLDHIDGKTLKKYGMHVMCPVVTNEYINYDISEEAMKDYWGRLKAVYGRERWRKDSNNN